MHYMQIFIRFAYPEFLICTSAMLVVKYKRIFYQLYCGHQPTWVRNIVSCVPREWLQVKNTVSSHPTSERVVKGGGGGSRFSAGEKQLHNFTCLKKPASRFIYITVCSMIYHVPLDRLDQSYFLPVA